MKITPNTTKLKSTTKKTKAVDTPETPQSMPQDVFESCLEPLPLTNPFRDPRFIPFTEKQVTIIPGNPSIRVTIEPYYPIPWQMPFQAELGKSDASPRTNETAPTSSRIARAPHPSTSPETL